MPILMNHYVMLQRNLIYTGITRAKKILVMVGTKKALAYAVNTITVTKRNTLLKERLSGNGNSNSVKLFGEHKVISYSDIMESKKAEQNIEQSLRVAEEANYIAREDT